MNSNPTFQNPILSGFHPDPSICRVGSDYYLATSTFHYAPGVPIFHSRDLVHWRQIGHVLNRPSQLLLEDTGPSTGIFAPTLRQHNGVFYMITTNVGKLGNFVVTATDPEGLWSNPIWIEGAEGIDPSLYFEDERCYYVGNGNPKRSLYDGHHTIWLQELDLQSWQLVGEKTVIVDGGTDIAREPIWIEGPHVYKVDGLYYLVAAEGGTGDQHSVVVFRSDKIDGPYESYSGNPIVTNRALDPARPNPITCTGHADLVQTQNGEWWMVLLGCRPYPPAASHYYNMGRETFLVPMTWKDGWPVSRDGSGEVKRSYPVPDLPEHRWADEYGIGSFEFCDDFDGKKLGSRWNFMRSAKPAGVLPGEREGHLMIRCGADGLTDMGVPAFAGIRQRHQEFTATTAMEFAPNDDGESAGIAVVQNSTTYFTVGLSRKRGQYVVRLERQANDGRPAEIVCECPVAQGRVELRISARGAEYSFAFSADGKSWTSLGQLDGTILSTRHTGGFVGAYVGLYAISSAEDSTAYADFDWFEYAGIDDGEAPQAGVTPQQ